MNRECPDSKSKANFGEVEQMKTQSYFGLTESKSIFIPDDSGVEETVFPAKAGNDYVGFSVCVKPNMHHVLSRDAKWCQPIIEKLADKNLPIRVTRIGGAGKYNFYLPILTDEKSIMEDALRINKEIKESEINDKEIKEKNLLKDSLVKLMDDESLYINGFEVLAYSYSLGRFGQFNRRPAGYMDENENLVICKQGELSVIKNK